MTLGTVPSPSSRTVRESICAILAVGLVDCLLKGSFKRLRLVYPNPITSTDPDQLCTISALRKGRRAFRGPKGLLLQYAWYGAPVSSYLTLLRGLQDLPDLNFVARFEHVTYPRSSRDSNVIVLSRLEDEPVKRDTVDRPPVKIVGPNSHLKRKLPGSPTSADPTPTKVRRLQLLQFLAFSESRNHNMSHQEVRDRFVGRNNELRRYINRAGLGSNPKIDESLATIPKPWPLKYSDSQRAKRRSLIVLSLMQQTLSHDHRLVVLPAFSQRLVSVENITKQVSAFQNY